MPIRHTIPFCALLLLVCAAGAQDKPPAGRSALPGKEDKTQLPPGYVPSGKQLYKQYCAACHGADGRGGGPAASSLKTPPPDLTTLAKRHGGKFPDDYVTRVLRFGIPVVAHGSSDMPVWGPIFGYLDHYNEVSVQQRIKNLCDHLASLQEKET
jgi:mono/diheme cytochrome c family protein